MFEATVLEGREFDPRPGQYSRMSVSSDQVTGTVFPHLSRLCLFFQILNLFRTLYSWGSGNYRPSAPLLCEVASHVKQLPFDHSTLSRYFNSHEVYFRR